MASAALASLIQANVPHRPYCANVKNAAHVRPQEIALSSPYLQLNSPTHHGWLTLDVDRRFAALAWIDAGLPPPTYIAANRENGHAHLGYALSAPVCTTKFARQAPLRYFAAIEHAYTARLNADFAFCGPLAKNPLHPMWHLWEPANAPTYELSYLAEFVDLPKRLPPQAAGVGRNCDMFQTLRCWSYTAIRDFWSCRRPDMWTEACLRQAQVFNTFEVPLGFSELRGIARSVSRFVWREFTPGDFSKIQSERGRRGGIASGEIRRSATFEQRVKAHALSVEGHSQRSIAAKLQVGQATIGRWLRQSPILD